MAKRMSKRAAAMVALYGDRMAARAVAFGGYQLARSYREDCEAHGNDDGATYWRGVEDAAFALAREFDGC